MSLARLHALAHARSRVALNAVRLATRRSGVSAALHTRDHAQALTQTNAAVSVMSSRGLATKPPVLRPRKWQQSQQPHDARRLAAADTATEQPQQQTAATQPQPQPAAAAPVAAARDSAAVHPPPQPPQPQQPQQPQQPASQSPYLQRQGVDPLHPHLQRAPQPQAAPQPHVHVRVVEPDAQQQPQQQDTAMAIPAAAPAPEQQQRNADIASPPPPEGGFYRTARRVMHEYNVGIKQLAKNFMAARRLQHLNENAKGDVLTRAQHVLLRQWAKDKVKLLTAAAFMVPILGNAVPFLGYYFPKILPSTFHSAATKLALMRDDSTRSFLYYNDALKSLDATIAFYRIRFARPELVEIFRHTTRVEEAAAQAGKHGREYTNAEIIGLAPVFQFFFPSIEALDHSNSILLEHLLVSLHQWNRTYVYWPRFLLQAKLLRHMRWIVADDERIKKEGGAEKLTLDELRDACHERGMYVHAWERDELVHHLNDWIELTTYVTPAEPAPPIPHLPVSQTDEQLRAPYLSPAEKLLASLPKPGSWAAAQAAGEAAARKAMGLPPAPETVAAEAVQAAAAAAAAAASTSALTPHHAPVPPGANVYESLGIRRVPTAFAHQYDHAAADRVRLPMFASDAPQPIPDSFPSPSQPPQPVKARHYKRPQPDVAPELKGTVFHLPPLPPNSRLPITLLMHAHALKYHHQKWQFPAVLDVDGETIPKSHLPPGAADPNAPPNAAAAAAVPLPRNAAAPKQLPESSGPPPRS